MKQDYVNGKNRTIYLTLHDSELLTVTLGDAHCNLKCSEVLELKEKLGKFSAEMKWDLLKDGETSGEL